MISYRQVMCTEDELVLNEAIIEERELSIREKRKQEFAQLVGQQGAMIGLSTLTSITLFLFVHQETLSCYFPKVVTY